MKRVLKNPLVPFLLAACICTAFGVFMSGDPFPAKEIYVYKPMVCINDRIYDDVGTGVESLPKGFVRAGEVREKVSDIEPMVEKNYASNTLDVGTEIFTSKENPDEIYLKLDESKYAKFMCHAKDDSDNLQH